MHTDRSGMPKGGGGGDSKRKRDAPKKLLSREPGGGGGGMSAKLPRLAGLGLPSRKVVTAAHPAIPEHPKSKFFFDMLMSLDHDIIGQYIMPHVMPAGANSQGGVRWLSAMYEVSLSCGRPGKEEKDEGGGGEEEKDEGAGFMKRNIFHSFVMPSIEAAPPSWRYVTTNLSDYIMFGKIKSKEMLRGIVKAVHGNHGSIGLCMDFVQCGGCSWAIYGNTGQGCERVSTVNIVWDCDNYAKFLVREADGFAEARVNLRRIKLTGMDVCTHIGRTLCDSAREVVSKMGTPMCLVLKNTITNESGLDKVCKLISDCCMRRCTTVVVDEFVFMGRADREGMQPQILEAMSSSSSSRVSSSSPVTKLVIAGCSMPIGRLDSMRCAMAILKLPSLDNLEINTKHPVGRGFDSTAQLLKGFGFCMYESDKNIFHSLRKLTLSFGDSSFTSSRVIVAHDPQGVTHVDIVDNPSVSDDGSSSSGGEEEEEPVGDAVVTVPYRDDPDLAFCISHVNAPFLEVVNLRGSTSPMSTLKIMTFLRSMIKVRDVVLPPPDGDATTFFRKLKCVTARATYMPDTITRQPSAFLVHLSNITDRFEENHRVAYVPGSPVWAWEIAQPGGGWGGGAGGVGGAEQEPEAYD